MRNQKVVVGKMAATGKKRKPTAKQLAFVDAYCECRVAKEAAIKAGYSARSAEFQGYQLMQKPLVRGLIDERLRESQMRSGITVDRVLKELARIALFDPRSLFDAEGHPLPITELSDDAAAALAGMEVVIMRGDGDGPDKGFIRKYKISDKNSALDKLMRQMGMFERDNRQRDDPITALAAFIAERTGGSSRLPIADE